MDTTASRTTAPLEGTRILDLSRLLPGPFCSQLLADFGADVIKVEDLSSGDYARWTAPRFDGAEESAASAFFAALNRNKRSIQVDLKHPLGRALLLDLLERADVLLESFRPGVLARLGLGYELLLERNPGLVICPITGYGQDGPYRDRSGHDLNYLAATGVLDLCGDTDGPVQAAVQIADIGGGSLLAACGILMALRHRDRCGEGQVVDISMADGALSWLAPLAAEVAAGSSPRRGALALGGGVLCYRVYRCLDGWVALGALEPKFFAAFCRAAGCEELLESQFDPPGSPAHASLEAIFAARSRVAWSRFAADHDCCLEVVRTLDEALASDLVRERGMVVGLAQPGRGGPIPVLANPIAMSRTPADHHRRPVPALGEHTLEVLREAGLDERRVAALLDGGVVRGPDGVVGAAFLS